MKKLGALLLVLVIALGISVASTTSAFDLKDYEKYFGPIFDGNVFNSSSIFNDTVEQKELGNVTPSGILPSGWANETRHSNFPEGYFNVTPKGKWTDKPANWFNETPKEQHSNFPPGWFDIV